MKNPNTGAIFLALMRTCFKASGPFLLAVGGLLTAQAASITLACTGPSPYVREGAPGMATCTVSNPFQNDVALNLNSLNVNLVFAGLGETADWAGNARFDPTASCFTAGLAKTKPGDPLSTCQANILFDTDEKAPQGKPETTPENTDFGDWWLRASVQGSFVHGRTGDAGVGANYNLSSNPVNNGTLITVADAPEPSTLGLLGLGALLIAVGSRRLGRKLATR
jgi:hypothetical protein